MTKAPPRSAPDRRRAVRRAAPARLRAWPTDAGHRPERHHMRGGRPPAVGSHP